MLTASGEWLSLVGAHPSLLPWSLHLLPGQMGRVIDISTTCGEDQGLTRVQVELLKAQQEPLLSWVEVVEVMVVVMVVTFSFQGCPAIPRSQGYSRGQGLFCGAAEPDTTEPAFSPGFSLLCEAPHAVRLWRPHCTSVPTVPQEDSPRDPLPSNFHRAFSQALAPWRWPTTLQHMPSALTQVCSLCDMPSL